MLERTELLRARIVPAVDLRVGVRAARLGAVGAVTARWLFGVAEGAGGIVAVGEEFAVDFLLEVLGALGGGDVAADAFAVFAGGAEGAGVAEVHCLAGRCGGGLVCVGASGVGAVGVEAAGGVEGFFLVAF